MYVLNLNICFLVIFVDFWREEICDFFFIKKIFAYPDSHFSDNPDTDSQKSVVTA